MSLWNRKQGFVISTPENVLNFLIIVIIIIIIIFINCNWVITRWQWLYYMYTNMGEKK